MPTLQLSDAQKAKLAAAGIDWQKLLALLGQYGPVVMQIILAILGIVTPPPVAQAKPKGQLCCDCEANFQVGLDASLASAQACLAGLECCQCGG